MIDVRAAVRRFGARLASMVSRGIVTRVDDSKPTQVIQIQLRADEVADLVEHLQPWGVSFHPTPQSEVVVLAVGGEQRHLVALNATDRSLRPKDASEGEGGLYTPTGWKVYLADDGTVSLSQKGATQSFMRGQDVKAALDNYTTAVASAVGVITAAGVAKLNTEPAVAQLNTAANQLSSAIQQALSTKVKGE